MVHVQTRWIEAQQTVVSRCRMFACAVAWFVIVTGMLVLIGWATGLETLKRVLPGLVAMNPATAVAIILCGVALKLRIDEGTIGWKKRLAMTAVCAVMLIGAACLMGYATAWDPKLDQLLFAASVNAEAGGLLNRMAPNTALALVLCSTALLVLDVRTRRGGRPSEWLAGLLGAVALLAALGHLYRVPVLYAPTEFIGMALHTAICLVLLTLGVLAARPRGGVMAELTTALTGGIMARRLIPGAVLTVVTLSWLRLQGQLAGLYDTEFGVSVTAGLTTMLMIAMIAWLARRLNRIDAARLDTEAALQRTLEEMNRKHHLLQTILDSAGDGIVVADEQARFVQWNPAARRLVGLGPDDQQVEHWAEHYGVFLPDGVTPFPSQDLAMVQALRGRSVDDQEQFLRNPHVPSGRWVSVTARPLTNPDGSSGGGVVVFRDVTDRKRAKLELEERVTVRTAELTKANAALQQEIAERTRAEEFLRLGESRQRAIFDSALDAIIVMNHLGMVVDFNRSAETMFGYSRAQALNRSLAELIIPPALWAAHAEGLATFVTTGRGPVLGRRLELPAVRCDGAEITVELSIVCISGSAPPLFTGFLRDISERKRAEERLRLVVEAAPTGMMMIDRDGRIVLVNTQMENQFGYGRQELLGQPVEMLIPSRFRAEHPAKRAGFFADPRVRMMGAGRELYGLRRNGSEFPVEIGLNPITTESGSFVLASVIDITQRKLAEKSLAERAAELARSNSELEQFAYVASHDLQEPLRMVASYTELLAKRYGGRLDADADEYIRFAVDGANRMKQLITDLLQFSRVDRRGQAMVALDANRALTTALENLRVAVQESGAVVSSDTLPSVRSDSEQLVQVFQNLLGNAIKYRGKARPEIHVSAAVDGAMCRFTVRDNGIGIDPQHAERIFGLFQRLHTRQEYPGTGIGLAICRKIVERHHGRIWVESSPGRGAAFHFTIPLEEVVSHAHRHAA